LFAAFQPEAAYLLDIMEHGAWTSEHLIEVIVREWPGSGLVHELQGASGLNRKFTEQDRGTLRSKHANALLEIDGKVYMPAAGLMTSGVSMRAVRSADHVLHVIRWFENEMRGSRQFIAGIFDEAGVAAPSEVDLHFEFFENGGFGVVERNTGLRIRLSN
jgi:hypothetical protein